MYGQELEEHQFHASTPSENDRAEAWEIGGRHSERPWVLTDRDVWHQNPYFQCPVGQPYPPHPEDDDGRDA